MTKLNGHSPLRVFIGTSPGGEDAEACMVLEHSLRSRASVPIEVEWLRLSRDPASPYYSDPKSGAGWSTEKWGTPWTALRWAVPEVCGFVGRAVYFDCSTVAIGDVAELERAVVPRGALALMRQIGTALSTACVVFDCAEARKHLPPLESMRADFGAHQAVGALLDNRPRLVGPLPGDWGMSDAEYARLPTQVVPSGSVSFPSPLTQPHAPRALARLARAGRGHWHDAVRLPHYCARLVELFDIEYARAVAAGYSVEQYVPEEEYGPVLIGAARAEAGRNL